MIKHHYNTNYKKTNNKGKGTRIMNVISPAFPTTRTVLECGEFQLNHTEGYGYSIVVPQEYNVKLNVSGGFDPELKCITYKVSVISTKNIINTIEDIEKMSNDLDNALYVAQHFESMLNYGEL